MDDESSKEAQLQLYPGFFQNFAIREQVNLGQNAFHWSRLGNHQRFGSFPIGRWFRNWGWSDEKMQNLLQKECWREQKSFKEGNTGMSEE